MWFDTGCFESEMAISQHCSDGHQFIACTAFFFLSFSVLLIIVAGSFLISNAE